MDELKYEIKDEIKDEIEDVQCSLCYREFEFIKRKENDKICDICKYETPIVKNNYHIFQKYTFILFIIGINVLITYLWYVPYRSVYWVILIVIPRIRDIILILLITFYNILFYKCKKKENNNENDGKIISVNIFCYCERYELIIRNLNAIKKNYEKSNDKYIICIVLDGSIIGKRNEDTLYKMFKKDNRFENFNTYEEVIEYKSWVFKENKITVSTCNYKEIPVIILEKKVNMGKKDSIFLSHKIFSNVNNYPNTERTLFKIINNYLKENNINYIDYSFKTDADAYVDDDTILLLKKKLESDETIDAVCGFMRIEYKTSRGKYLQFWNIYQDFQFFAGQIIRRTAEGILGKIICIPGPIGLYRLNKHHDSVLEKYVLPPNKKSLLAYLNTYIGTDRRLTNLILGDTTESKIKFVSNAHGYTNPPQNFKTYLSQRERWTTNLITNSLIIMFTKFRIIPWYSKINSFIDIFRIITIYFRLIFSVWFMYRIITEEGKTFTMLFILGYIIPVLYILFRMIREEKRFYLFIGWILNRIINPLFYVIIVTKVFISLGNVKWGKTQKLKKIDNIEDKNDIKIEIVKMEEESVESNNNIDVSDIIE